MVSETTLVRGDIVTMDAAMPRAEAMALRGDRIVAVGMLDAVRAALSEAPGREIRYDEGTVVPGLIDTHNHMHWTGMQARLVDLRPARCIADIQEAIRAYAARFPGRPWTRMGRASFSPTAIPARIRVYG